MYPTQVQTLIQDFSLLENWEDRYQYIIELGKRLPPFPSEYQIETYRVAGCQSQVWIHPEEREGKLYFDATSDALIVKGLIALLKQVYSGRTREEILAISPDFIKELGLDKHLSQTRSNGLYHMLKTIFDYATIKK